MCVYLVHMLLFYSKLLICFYTVNLYSVNIQVHIHRMVTIMYIVHNSTALGTAVDTVQCKG